MQPPILITGAARSGTSLVAGIVNLCGAFGGVMSGPNSNNKKGMFENQEIRNRIVKPYLVSIGADRMGQNPLPDIARVRDSIPTEAARIRNAVLGIMERQGYSGGPWFYKGAKLCLLWPLWHAAFPDARWIILRRPDDDIIASCLRTSFMRAYHTADGWRTWLSAHKLRFDEMADVGCDIRVVWSNDVVTGRHATMHAIAACCGLRWNKQRVDAFVDPSLWHAPTEKVRT